MNVAITANMPRITRGPKFADIPSDSSGTNASTTANTGSGRSEAK